MGNRYGSMAVGLQRHQVSPPFLDPDGGDGRGNGIADDDDPAERMLPLPARSTVSMRTVAWNGMAVRVSAPNSVRGRPF